MSTKTKFQAIRGTRDLLPPDTQVWNHVEQTAHQVFGTFGFGEIRLPIFEQTDLFARAVGADTDVVSKEMYSFIDNAVPRVGLLADVITSWADPLKDEEQFRAYQRYVKDFVQELKRAIDSGEIPGSEANKHALQEVGERFEALSNTSLENLQSRQLALGCIRAIYLGVRFAELGNYLTLRPEATASVCRAYIEHNMQQLPQPVKLYYMGPMFRRERPQKGRYRQFYQIGAEVLEVVRPNPAKQDAATDSSLATRHSPLATSPDLLKDAVTDAEVIEMVMTFFDRLGLSGVQLDINSIGHAADNCRRGYVAKLKSALEQVKDKLGADSQRRIETNPLRVLDSKLEHEQPIIATLPKIADNLCDDCKAHYAAVKHQLELRGVLYKENWRLVRGLDYYMRTTFEITAKGLGSQDAVCGGGRYDGLVELLGGPPTKGIGFAIGEDRLILSLQASGKAQAPQGRDIYIAWMGDRAYATAVRAAKDLRKAGFSVELPPTELKFGKALERASKLNSRFALILGDNEVSVGLWTLKTLADGTQAKFTEPQLLDFLRSARGTD
jgi:histidyl-tRNA synthetase